jgi:two-component system OmpR family response regulator
VLWIDDDEALTVMMTEFLSAEGFTCETTANPVKGLEWALSGRFDVAVLDVMMPGLDGIELLRRLRHVSALPVLMLTAKGGNIDRVLGLELGADDYVTKPVYPLELVARLRAIMRRARPGLANAVTPEICVGRLRILPQRHECFLADKALTLTGTEFEVLLQLARRPDDVVSKDELSEAALRRQRQPYDRSIDVHVSRLRGKLSAAGGGVEIETVRAIGYRLRQAS